MTVPVGLNVWSRLVEELFPYLDQVVGPFDSLWFSDHVQYEQHKVAEGRSLLTYALARYPDKLCGHDVLCNSFSSLFRVVSSITSGYCAVLDTRRWLC